MKKLMIAAAAAAMIGGAWADGKTPVAKYDFVATLKTTIGAQGQATIQSYYARLGTYGTYNNWIMWYQDELIDDFYSESSYLEPLLEGKSDKRFYNDGTLKELKVNKEGVLENWKFKPAKDSGIEHLAWEIGVSAQGKKYPKIVIIPTQQDNGTLINVLNETEHQLLTNLANRYNDSSYGYWCGEYTWFSFIPAQCFRVAGVEQIVDEVILPRNYCCNSSPVSAFYSNEYGYPEIVFDDLTTDPDTGDHRFVPAVLEDLVTLNRFGAQNVEQANLLELSAVVDAYTTISDREFCGFLAGQGYQALFIPTGDNTAYNIPAQITGMIVGGMEPPVCPDCCTIELPYAIAFWCLDDTVASGYMTSPAFGTFYISFKDFTLEDY